MLSTKTMVIGLATMVCFTVAFVVGAWTGFLFQASLFNLTILFFAWVVFGRVRAAETEEELLRKRLTRPKQYDPTEAWKQARGCIFDLGEPPEVIIRRLREDENIFQPVYPLREIYPDAVNEIARMSGVSMEDVVRYLCHRGYVEQNGNFYAVKDTKEIAFGPIPSNWSPEENADA